MTWTVTLSANDGTGVVSQVSVKNGSDYAVPECAFARSGYNFVRWNTAADGAGTAYNPGGVIAAVSANVSLYAIWAEKPSYAVAFDANGGSGSMDSASVLEGSSLAVPANAFTRTGYSFARWNTKADGTGVNYSAGETIAAVGANLTLFAIWTPKAVYTVSFDHTQGTGSMDPVQVFAGDSYIAPACAFSRADYNFSHWNTLSNGSGASYSSGATIPAVNASFTLYAMWTARPTYSVTYHANGGDGGSMTAGTVIEGNTYTVPAACGFTRTGYHFLRWNTLASGLGTDYPSGASMPDVRAAVDLYAVWEINTYAISYHANSGSGSMASGSAAHGSSYTLSACAFTLTGNHFLRWDTHSAGDGTSYPGGAAINPVTADLDLYAIWEINTYAVSFDANYGTGSGTGSMAPGSVAHGGTYVVPACGFSKAGDTFVFWNTLANGTGTRYNAGDSIANVTSSITLHAIWGNVIDFIDFDQGQTLAQIFSFDDPNDAYTTPWDDSGTLSIQNAIAVSGYALRKNLANQHLLERMLPEGNSDFWMMFDTRIVSTDVLPADAIHTPLVLFFDSSTLPLGAVNSTYLGTPVVDYLPADTDYYRGYLHLRVLTSVQPAAFAESVMGLTPIRYFGSYTSAGQDTGWLNVKYHVDMDGSGDSIAGVDLYINNTRVINTITARTAGVDMPVTPTFDVMRIWYHDPDVHLPNTDIYLDNIGVYRTDPTP
jgi:uncharacterized repeat protein (TIGR02543 family)